MKSVVITGVTGTLGLAIASCLLADPQWRVLGVGRRRSGRLNELAREYPDRLSYVEADLSHPRNGEVLYLETLKGMGPINGFVNNAAVAYDDLVSNADVDRLEEMFRVNVLTPIILTKYVVRDMLLHRTPGSIVHISSVSTRIGYKGLSMYAATKGAMEAFSLGVAREWGSKGVRSNCVAAGFMDTNMTRNLSDEQRERISRRTSLGDQVSTGSVAAMVRHLLSDEASSVTGAVFRVDAGA